MSSAYKLPWSMRMTDVSVTYVWKKIMDYPDNYVLSTAEDAQSFNFLIGTYYFHDKLHPQVFYMRDIEARGYMLKPSIQYKYTNEWIYDLGMLKFGGSRNNQFADVFKNKNHLYFTVTYQFG